MIAYHLSGLMLPLAALLPLAKAAPAFAAEEVTTPSGLKYSVIESGTVSRGGGGGPPRQSAAIPWPAWRGG